MEDFFDNLYNYEKKEVEIEYTLKMDKLNVKSMIEGYKKDNQNIKTSIFLAKSNSWSIKNNFETTPKLISLSSSTYSMSEIGKKNYDRNYSIPNKYIAILDSYVIFWNNYQLWWELCNDGTFDIWNPEAPFNNLKNNDKPRILILRIFEIDRPINKINNSIQYYGEVNATVQLMKPILNDSEFNSIKNNVIGKVDSNKKDFECLKSNIKNFLEQSQKEDLQTKEYLTEVFGVSVDKSFGREGKAKIAWISFLLGGNRTSEGVYPALLYDHKESKLFLVYGVSEINKAKENWPSDLIKYCEKVSESNQSTTGLKEKYPGSYIFKKYSVNKLDSFYKYELNELIKDIDLILHNYKNLYRYDLKRYDLPTEKYSYEEIPDPSLDLLERKKQIILYGPPGTGKTYLARRYAVKFVQRGNILNDTINEKFSKYRNNGQIEFITFHPSYSYEEFMEGITVHTEREGKATENIQYKLKSGIFKEMCKKALASATNYSLKEDSTWKEVFQNYQKNTHSGAKTEFEVAKRYVLIIDEINRGNISKIFGELITLLESDKRLGCDNELVVKLPYSNDELGVPPNLYVIGTMNTADRSIALIDIALRRRFGFKELMPDFEAVEKHIGNYEDTFGEELCELLYHSILCIKILNKRICEERTVGRDKQIGHSYFFTVKESNDIIRVWQSEILPLLEEYCYGNYEKVSQILFRREENKWINKDEGIKGFSSIKDLMVFLNEIIDSDKNE